MARKFSDWSDKRSDDVVDQQGGSACRIVEELDDCRERNRSEAH